jgi:hypothetical protein
MGNCSNHSWICSESCMELTTEFYRAAMVSWSCFIFGMILFHGYRNCRSSQNLSKILLWLSPAVLTAYGLHSVQVCDQILAAKGQKVDSRVFLTRLDTVRLRSGAIITSEQFSNSTVSRRLSLAGGRTGRNPQSVGSIDTSDGAAQGGCVSMQAQNFDQSGDQQDLAASASQF